MKLNQPIIFILLLFSCCQLCAQDSIKNKQYLFSDFQPAIAYYKEGSATRHYMNYNLLTDEMQILNAADRKEVFELFEDIESISIGLHEFIPLDLDFGEVVSSNGKIALVIKRCTKVDKTEGIGKITGGSRSKANKILERNSLLPTDMVLRPDSVYYLVRLKKPEVAKKGLFKGLALSQNRVVDISYNGFLKVYSDFKEQLNKYLKDKPVDFNKPADIIRFTEYCNSL